MSLDIDSLSPAAREHLRELGARYSSEDTLAQADRTQEALGLFGVQLVDHGYGSADQATLTDAKAELLRSNVGRELSRVGRKKTSADFVSALRRGKTIRQRARTVVFSAIQRLSQDPSEQAQEEARTLNAVLEQTQSCGAEPERLRSQLLNLAEALQRDAVRAITAERGGPKAIQDLLAGAEALRTATEHKPQSLGTPAATARLDVIDGIIVEQVRLARRAARSAARELGRPEIAQAFELVHLNSRKRSGPAGGDPPPVG